MTLVSSRLYAALREAEVSPETADKVAEEVGAIELRAGAIELRLKLIEFELRLLRIVVAALGVGGYIAALVLLARGSR